MLLRALRQHWPEYLAEACGLGVFMISACVFGTLLAHPESAVVKVLPDPTIRRVLMGLAMDCWQHTRMPHAPGLAYVFCASFTTTIAIAASSAAATRS